MKLTILLLLLCACVSLSLQATLFDTMIDKNFESGVAREIIDQWNKQLDRIALDRNSDPAYITVTAKIGEGPTLSDKFVEMIHDQWKKKYSKFELDGYTTQWSKGIEIGWVPAVVMRTCSLTLIYTGQQSGNQVVQSLSKFTQ